MNSVRVLFLATSLLSLVLMGGCSTVSVYNHPYLTVPSYPPTKPEHVQILPKEPAQPHDRLGEVLVDITGEPSRARIEKAIKTKAAKLGADAAFIVHDGTHLFPVVYSDWWGARVYPERHRGIVAVAIHYK